MDTNHGDLNQLMSTTMGKIKEMLDVNTIVGDAITTPDGTTIIPVSKLSFGYAAGGSDFGSATKNFAGGSGAGAKIDPVSFLIVNHNGVKLLSVNQPAGSTIDRIVEMAPNIIDKVQEYFSKSKDKDEY